MSHSFRTKGGVRTKVISNEVASANTRRAVVSIGNLELEMGLTSTAAKNQSASILVQTEPLEPGRSLFYGSEERIDDSLRRISNIDPIANSSGQIEVEMRLSDTDASRGISQFQRVLAWLQDSSRFGRVESETFREISYDISTTAGSHSTQFITRISSDPKIPKQEYYKTKLISQIKFPSVHHHGSLMGIALESKKYGNVNLQEIIQNSTANQFQKKRWKFPIDSNTASKLNIPATYWSRSLDVPSHDPSTPISNASIDITESMFIDVNGLKKSIYGIEIELDPASINYMKSVERTEYFGVSSKTIQSSYLSLSPQQFELLDTWSKIIITVITRSGTFLTNAERQDIKLEFEKILNVKMESKIVNKPRDLELKDFSWLSPEESPTFMAFGDWDNDPGDRLKDLSTKKIYKPLFSIPGGFYVSLKADGTRYFLLFSSTGIYLTNPLSGILTQISGIGSSSPFVRNIVPGTILDVEVIGDITPEGTLSKYDVLVFDVLAVEGKDVRSQTYTSRLQHIANVVSRLNDQVYINKIVSEVVNLDDKKTVVNRHSKSYAELFNIQAKPVYRLPDLASTLRLMDRPSAEEKLFVARASAEQFFNVLGRVAHVSTICSVDAIFDKQFQETHGIKWNTDGIILTPAEDEYLKTSDAYFQNKPGDVEYSLVRKWKPRMTIDFLVKRNQHNVLTLFTQVYISKSRNSNKSRKGKDNIVTVAGDISLSDLISQNSGSMANWNGNAVLDDSMEGNVIEFYWGYSERFSDYAFIKYADRYDRSSPNPANVVKAIWNLINNPITLEDLKGETLRRMNRYHNKVKDIMIAELSGEKRTRVLLDLGSGRGGDVRKWDKMALIYAVEPSMTDLRELISRSTGQEMFSFPSESISEESSNASFYAARRQVHNRSRISFRSLSNNIQIINGGAENLNLLKANIDEPVHAVTMFNALTFFYESREKLQSLIDTIKEFLIEGGYFYTIAFDGELFMNTLRNRPDLQFQEVDDEHPTLDKIATKNIIIEKAADVSCRKIWIRIAGGIVRGQYEYLINTREFVDIMADEGFRLLEERYLDEEQLLSAEEYWFSSCFKLMKFKSLSNPNKREFDSLLQSKLKQMEASQVIQPLEIQSLPEKIQSPQLQAVGINGLLRYGNPRDGSCYVHGILRAFLKPYKLMLENERRGMIVQLRKELAAKYTEEYHNSFGDGFFKTSEAPAYQYDVIKASLADASFWIPSYLMPFVGDYLNVNVHVLRGFHAEVYRFGNTSSHNKPGRRNIVLYWINDNHYETVGLLEANNQVRMVFADDHPLIVAIKKLGAPPSSLPLG